MRSYELCVRNKSLFTGNMCYCVILTYYIRIGDIMTVTRQTRTNNVPYLDMKT